MLPCKAETWGLIFVLFGWFRLIFLVGFSDDQRPDVNSGYFILLQYKPSTLLEYLFYWTAERPSLHGAWHQWIPCEVVRLTASELSGWLPCFRCLAVMWSGWLLPSCQADCLTPGWSNGVRFTLHSHPHLSLALVWPPTGLAMPTGQWAVTVALNMTLKRSKSFPLN